MGVKAADGSDGAGPSTAASGETEAVLVNILSSCAPGKGGSVGTRAADSSDAVMERVPRRLLASGEARPALASKATGAAAKGSGMGVEAADSSGDARAPTAAQGEAEAVPLSTASCRPALPGRARA